MDWNYQRTGSFEFSSIQNINLKNWNLYYFQTYKYGEDYADKIRTEITQKASKETTYAEQQNATRDLCLNYLKKDWLSYIYMHFKGAFKMFLDPGRFDIYNFFELDKQVGEGFLKAYYKEGFSGVFNYLKVQPLIIIIIIPILMLFNILKLIGFALFWKNNYKTAPKVFWFMLFIIAYITVLTGLIGASRFLVSVLPIYLLFAVLGFSRKKKPLQVFKQGLVSRSL
ncbi:hypothetical protein [Gelatiniphilus marinus]|uniref:DUF1189 domain-containing protein n=1 Tax=Gelatiniphilus marinus TaxID=1759464 RepID=A0ABW5JY02_9FLAO